MSSPRLRLLLDESITNPVAKGIQRLSRSAVYVRTNPSLKGRSDLEVAAAANAERRMIVAIDSDYKGISVEAGIIRLSPHHLDEDCL